MVFVSEAVTKKKEGCQDYLESNDCERELTANGGFIKVILTLGEPLMYFVLRACSSHSAERPEIPGECASSFPKVFDAAAFHY